MSEEIELDLGIDFTNDLGDIDLDGFELSDDFEFDAETRHIKPPIASKAPKVKYEHAVDLAKATTLEKGLRMFAIVSGNFVFGDYIEALIVENNLAVKRIVINTLSMSQNNIDSLANLINGGYVQKMDIIVSAYFYSHERCKGGLVPYLYAQLDENAKCEVQLAVAGTHCKTVTIETESGNCLTIHGSANLRSSGCLEQVVIEEGRELLEFNNECSDAILEVYSTIQREVRRKKLWEAIDG